MRKTLTIAGALLLTLPALALAQGHGHGGGGHPGGPGGGGGGGGGGGPHMGGGLGPGGGGEHRGQPPGGGGGAPRMEHGDRGGPPGGFRGPERHEGRPDFNGGPRPDGPRHGFDRPNGGPGPRVVVQDQNRVVVNDFRGPGPGPRVGRGLPPPPPRGGWHRGWYGGRVSGFRPYRASPFVYPRGWGYRRWGIGLVLPPILFGSAYYYSGWDTLGAYPPPPGDRWVRYGPDLLLVNIRTGRIDDAIYGAFY